MNREEYSNTKCKMCNVSRENHQKINHFFVYYDAPINWTKPVWDNYIHKNKPSNIQKN